MKTQRLRIMDKLTHRSRHDKSTFNQYQRNELKSQNTINTLDKDYNGMCRRLAKTWNIDSLELNTMHMNEDSYDSRDRYNYIKCQKTRMAS